jgi:FKBP-type peptidyl-prolyl cis-trans isomerase
MRSLLLLALMSGLAMTTHAQQEQPPAAQPVQAQPAPQGVPVPDLPVIEKKELENGLVIEDMKIGDGYEIKPGDAVVAFYHGTLRSNGAEFDSAYRRGEPTPFSLEGVIQGWQLGVPGMKVGGIRRLTIPAALAYGESGRPSIPPNSDLVFVIELTDALHWKEVTEGTGEEATVPCVAVAKQTITTADGKKVNHDGYIWIPGELQFSPNDDAVQNAIEGMKVGGKRIIHVPKEMNRVNPMVTGRPTNVACDIELELVQVRNLRPRPAAPQPQPQNQPQSQPQEQPK